MSLPLIPEQSEQHNMSSEDNANDGKMGSDTDATEMSSKKSSADENEDKQDENSNRKGKNNSQISQESRKEEQSKEKSAPPEAETNKEEEARGSSKKKKRKQARPSRRVDTFAACKTDSDGPDRNGNEVSDSEPTMREARKNTIYYCGSTGEESSVSDDDEFKKRKKKQKQKQKQKTKTKPPKPKKKPAPEEKRPRGRPKGAKSKVPKKVPPLKIKRIRSKVACEHCGKVMSKTYLSEHTVRVHSDQIFSCTVCGRVVNSPRSLEHHMKVKHSEDSPYKCTICNAGLSSGKALNNHMIRCHGSPNDKPFKCDICEKRFLLKYDLQSHVTTHMQNRDFICDACGRGFRTKGNLKAHYRTHTGEKPFKCRYCSQEFSFRNSLQGHERRHTGENPYLCSACGKGFPVKHALNKHAVVHSDERPFKCTQCEKSFRSRSAFDMHKDFHLGVKRWECHICKRRFLCQGNMIKHRRRHLADRPHVCEICNKGFCEKQELRTHMKTHTGEKRLPIKKRKQSSSEKELVIPDQPNNQTDAECKTYPEAPADFSSLPTDNTALNPCVQNSVCDKPNMYQMQQFFNLDKHQEIVDNNAYRPPPVTISTSGAGNANPHYSSMLQRNHMEHQQHEQNVSVSVNSSLLVSDNVYHPQSMNNQYTHSSMNLNAYEHFHMGNNNANIPNHLNNPAAYLQQPCKIMKTSAPVLRCTLCKKDFTSDSFIRKHLVEYHRVTDCEGLFNVIF